MLVWVVVWGEFFSFRSTVPPAAELLPKHGGPAQLQNSVQEKVQLNNKNHNDIHVICIEHKSIFELW